MTETNHIEGIFMSLGNLHPMKNKYTQNLYQSWRHEWKYIDYLSGSLSVNYVSHVRMRSAKIKCVAKFTNKLLCFHFIDRVSPNRVCRFVSFQHHVSTYSMEFLFILDWHYPSIISSLFFKFFFFFAPSFERGLSRKTEKYEEKKLS